MAVKWLVASAAIEGPEPLAGMWPKPVESGQDPDRCRIFPGEGEDLVNGTKKNWFTSK